jgi:FSR family fosmidomycin resistance protein-like MFS transporter
MLLFILIVFFDELVYGVGEAAWPLIRTELALSYLQIGLIQTLPIWLGNLLEPFFGILSDTRGYRRRIILLGGIGYSVAVAGMMGATGFLPFLFAALLYNPSSGAFVSMSLTALMDSDPKRHEQNMARWAAGASAGALAGSVLIGILVVLGLSWRIGYGMALILGVSLTVTAIVLRSFGQSHPKARKAPIPLREFLPNVIEAARKPNVIRWLVLLQFSNLMMDVLFGYLALYFVDVVNTDGSQAAIAVTIWTGIGLIGDILLIPLLERVRGLDYLRVSAVIEFVLFIALLVIPGVTAKYIILALLGFFNAGWYPILEAQVYNALPRQSGMVATLASVTSTVGSLLPLGMAALAEVFGLGVAIWVCLLGPIALFIGIPSGAVSVPLDVDDEEEEGGDSIEEDEETE